MCDAAYNIYIYIYVDTALRGLQQLRALFARYAEFNAREALRGGFCSTLLLVGYSLYYELREARPRSLPSPAVYAPTLAYAYLSYETAETLNCWIHSSIAQAVDGEGRGSNR